MDEHGGAHRLQARLVLAGFDLGEGEQVFGETVHAAGVFENDGHELAGVIGQIHLVFEEGFDVAGDGGERGAQLVGDVGDEVAAGFLSALDFGDVMENGDGSAIGGGRGADFKGAAGDDGDGAADADAALAEGGVDAAEDLGVANADDQGLPAAGGPGAMRCMTEFDQLTWPLALTATTASCMESSRAASSRCLSSRAWKDCSRRLAVASRARATSPISSLPSCLDAGSEIAGGDAAGEIDDAAQAAGDAMREQRGGEDGQHQGDERGGEQIAAQDVQRGGLLHGAEGGDAGFFVEGMGDDVAEGKVQDRRGDAQHEDKGEQEFGEDSAGHGEVQRTAFSVQRSAEMPVRGHSADSCCDRENAPQR